MSAALSSFAALAALAEIAPAYQRLRAQHPQIPARQVHEYLRCGAGESIEQYLCGHRWAYTGTAYGGDDESYHGEGRCYCLNCGMDGDA